jgi:hypothetical protein
MSLKIDFTLNATAGYQFSTGVAQQIQDDSKRIEESLTLLAGGNTNGAILKGLTFVNALGITTFAAGYFVWNGQIVTFAGGAVATPGGGEGDILFTITEVPTNLEFCDTTTNLAYTLVTGTLENGGTTGDIAYSAMTICKDLCELEVSLGTTNGTVTANTSAINANAAVLTAQQITTTTAPALLTDWNNSITLATVGGGDPSEFTTLVPDRSFIYKEHSGKVTIQGELAVVQITFGASTEVKVFTIVPAQLTKLQSYYPSALPKIHADFCIFDDGTNYEQLDLYIDRATGVAYIAGKSSTIVSTVLAGGSIYFKFSYFANNIAL